jgi:hypothetical protein
MGEVYRARDTRLGRDVAVKILPADVANDSVRRQRFEQEARAVAALNHPNIVAIYDVGDNYIVTELVDGEQLRGAKPSLRKTIEIGAQIASGLACAHDAGITHRDLKPDNILLTRDGRVKILDFGLAKVPGAMTGGVTETLTEPGTVMGTVSFMSPEQVRGAAIDHRSDIFSLGLVLYGLLAGKRAFKGDTSVETMTAILKQDPAELPGTVPGALRQIVSHCLEKDPANRFQSAKDLAFALSQIGGQTGTAPILAKGVPSRRRPYLMLAGVVIAALAFVGGRMLSTNAPTAWTGTQLGGPEIAMGPRISPDGHTLAFQAMVGQNTQVAVMKPETGNWQILTHQSGAGHGAGISWSPDGNRLYYGRAAGVPMGIYTVPVLGGDAQLLLEDAAAPEALPDGSLLVIKLNAERNLQVFRFWPDSGKIQGYPLDVGASGGYYPVRAFPDGSEAVGVARLMGQDPVPHLYAIDLQSGHVRRIETGLADDSSINWWAPSADGRSILGIVGSDLARIVAIPRSGSSTPRTLFTAIGSVEFLDSGLDGSIYAVQADHRLNLVRFRPEGGRAQKAAAFAQAGYYGSELCPLADGRVVVGSIAAGRRRLVAVELGKDPVPLVNTSEETTAPVTSAGPNQVAFLIGAEPRRTIALASVANGRITRRIPFDRGVISSLASSPDGKTIYCAAGGAVWSIPPGGEPRKICAGESVAADPGGQSLIVKVIEAPQTRLLRVPLDGSPPREIPLTGPFHLTFDALASAAVGRDGRMVAPLASLDSWFFVPGIVDLKTGAMTRISVDHLGDYHSAVWTSDGQIVAAANELRSSIWRFRPKGR